MKDYWDRRFRSGGRIWGDAPSRTAGHALGLFRGSGVVSVLVPGSGYGRNSRLFAEAGFEVTGIEISAEACALARAFDPLTRVVNASVLDASLAAGSFDAVYCFNVLHFFRLAERSLMVRRCAEWTRPGGLLFFTVFSDSEPSYGTGEEVETNTFESKPGRPVHYYTGDDLAGQFRGLHIVETGLAEDPEDHGEGPHTHVLRYICLRR